jgi:hypothetical protein
MTKKRFLLLASVPLVIVVTLGVPAVLPPNTCPGVTKANFDRIQEGMTKAEVEGIFGREGIMLGIERPVMVLWETSDGSRTCITFKDNCVRDKNWNDSDETTLDKIRRWLHLR